MFFGFIFEENLSKADETMTDLQNRETGTRQTEIIVQEENKRESETDGPYFLDGGT